MTGSRKIKYIVSACLAGEKCRYDGNSNTVEGVMKLVENGTAVTVCPETLGGLPVPRVRCELFRLPDGSVKVAGEDGNDYTAHFIRGAQLAFDSAKEKGIKTAILKQKSPSCGCGLIYDGTFSGKLIEGNGILAGLFIESGINVITEIEFEQLPDNI